MDGIRIGAGGSMRQRVLRNLAWLSGGNGLAAVLSMLATAANSRALGLTDFGALVLLQSSALLIAGLFSFATQQPVVKLGVAALQEGDRPRFELLLGMGFLADALGAGLAAITGLAVVLLAPESLGLAPQAKAVALIVAASLAFQGYRTAEGIFRAFDRFDLMGLIQVAAAGVQLILAVALWALRAPFIYYAALLVTTIALPSIAQLTTAIAILRRRGYRPRLHGVSGMPEDRREFVDYCWTTTVTSTCDTLRNNGDSTLIGLLVSVEAAGAYNVAKQLAGIVRKAAAIYASVVFPELAALAADGRAHRARQLLMRASLGSLAVTVVIAGVAAALGGIALRVIFGPAFEAGHFALVILSAAAGLQLLSATYSMYAQVFIGPVSVFRGYLAATAMFVPLITVGVGVLGMIGAAWAQLIFFVTLAAVCRWQLRRSGELWRTKLED